MDIYFAGSIRGGRADVNLYLQIISYLKEYGKVLTEHVGNTELTALDDGSIYRRDMRWMDSCDVVIAEVTTPSLGVGMEIAWAIERGKKILCLHRPQKGKRLSALVAGCPDIVLERYCDLKGARDAINRFLRVFVVEKIELSDQQRKSLTTSVSRIP